MTASAPSAELTRLVGAQPGVLRSICSFNQNPADYLDESRRHVFFGRGVSEALWTCPRSRRHLSRHILARIGSAPCLETHRPEWPLALLERARIDRLARHVAAALAGSRVRRCVSRTEVLKWREWLSPEAHEFALTRAGLLPFNVTLGDESEHMTAQELGHAWIVAASTRWAEAIARRFVLKLPEDAQYPSQPVDAALAWRLVSSVLLNVESRWCSSFATMRA